ncbi:MAG: hypothetical protein GYB31_11275 [Bacteroidetes bacterium]|nr:hypothetical protein [Bacteroidota bacterium]
MQKHIGKFIRPLSLLSAFLFLLAGCSKDAVDPGTLVDVPLTFNVQMIEKLDTSDRRLQFRVSTIEFQDCLNETIDYNMSQNYSNILLSLNEILEPETCEEGNAPAVSQIQLEQLINNKYLVSINLKNTVENVGELEVFSDRYRLQLETTNGIQILNPELNRVPENVIWGSFAYRNEDHSFLAEDFQNELEIITTFENFPVGDYGHFYVINNQNIFVADQSPEELSFRQNFLFHYDGDFEDIQGILSEFRNTYQNEIHILLMDDKGRSW